MKKLVIFLVICFWSIAALISGCSGGSSEALASTDKLLINDIQVDSRGKFDAPHFDKNGNMIMPLEFVCQMQGFEYSQSSDGKSATVKLGDKTVTATKGSDKITTSSGESQMPVKTTLKKGTLYVPAEPVLMALGYTYKVESSDEGEVAKATGVRGKAKYETELKKENFDTDPGVYGERNVDDVSKHDIITQDFGYKNYNGENVIGGDFQRNMDKSYYAIDLPKELTLNDSVSFSGKFVVPSNTGNSDVLFGFFNHNTQDYRCNNYMCLRLDGDAQNKYFVYFEHGTSLWTPGSVGCFSTPDYHDSRGENPGDPDDRLKASPDQWHEFSLTYDPNGNSGTGTVTGILEGKTYSYNLSQENRAAGAVFNQFGLMTQMNIGLHIQAYFKDLTLNGQAITDLSPNGGWKAVNNVLKNQPASVGKGLNVIGYNTGSDIDKSKPGQFGGIVWRLDENRYKTPSYAGVPTGLLDLTQPLHATGKIEMTGAGKDSALVLGWFNSKTPGPDVDFVRDTGPRNSIGAFLEGLSAVGHYFRPIYAPNSGKGEQIPNGPVLHPQQIYNFTIDYTPNADGTGTLITTINGVPAPSQIIPKGVVDTSVFDTFGVESYVRGGMYIKFAIDDIEYTVRK